MTLRGRVVILKALGDVGLRRVLLWIEEHDAPVRIEGQGNGARWFADSEELERWRVLHLASLRVTTDHSAPQIARPKRARSRNLNARKQPTPRRY